MVDSSIALVMMGKSVDRPSFKKASLPPNWQVALEWASSLDALGTEWGDSVLTAMLLLRFGYSRSQNG